ncbi:MAG: hypothetical protein KBE27_01345 [Syntrophorhabdaceae bacterium]|nr:hypothetical protein [Syntrophorhabdales bacterium]MBP9560448.1 hypothetical protein [Syntrophorhabdaceae bacterium]
MTHKDLGNYAEKRKGVQLNEVIATKVREKTYNNRISCAEAHGIAMKLDADPDEVGATIDLLEIHIIECQLGLFGQGDKNIPALTEKVDPDIDSAIKSSLYGGRLKCIDAWNIAKRFNIPKPLLTAICESMKIKISVCQLGTFR